MRALILTTSFPLSDNSMSGVFVLRLIEHLPPGIEVTVLTPCHNAYFQFPSSMAHKVKCFRYAPRRWQLLAHVPGGIPDALKRNPVLWFFVPILLLSMFFSCLRLSLHADIIHAHWAVSGVIAGVIGFITRKPVITTLRGTDVARASKSLVARQALRLCAKLNQKVITVSKWMQATTREYVRGRSEKLLTITNGVDQSFLNVGAERRDEGGTGLQFGTIGNLIASKQINTIIRAFGRMRDRNIMRLLVIGDGPEEQSLKAMVMRLGLSQNVTFVGRVAPTQIPEYLAALDALVLSSSSEGRPNAVLEAMAAGVPVIASDIAGVRELIQDGTTGLLFPVGDDKQLVTQMERLVTDPVLRVRLSEAGRDFILANRLLWTETGLRYGEIYADLVSHQ
jgi:glycosyltransferase involved in cell wall biosynthesis